MWEMKQREQAGWKEIVWNLDSWQYTSLIQARLIAPNPEDPDNAFAQITMRMRSTQTFAVYDVKDQLLAGSMEKQMLVDDHWVFERALQMANSKWRLAGRISIPPQ
ncbi:hypothetical protein CYMTET_41944 [Cymbomonas tetramitiformis]|uniref:Large ribosomal subunit protein mL45 n=1 Tax=Cymbomonas tetramitiformis TaxID=36881 RepID=A0AAE0C534_9CHLO|nr:hypothetical protein CYMTET_41944 [Cymbomonas tetramitiformis]